MYWLLLDIIFRICFTYIALIRYNTGDDITCNNQLKAPPPPTHTHLNKQQHEKNRINQLKGGIYYLIFPNVL